jgi:hypothetical protein
MRLRRGAALAVVVALAAGAPACGGDDPARPPLLPAGAPPAAVAREYVKALDRGDVEGLRELTTADFAAVATGWLPNLEKIRLVRVDRVEEDDAIGRSLNHREAVHVSVDLDLDFYDPTVSGFSRNGRATWGYILVRDAPADPWRVGGEGTG